MIDLRPTSLRWVSETEDASWDQCAHGDVVFTIDSIPFATGERAENVTVSAAALFLLRTLTDNHTAANPVAEGSQLFPCCGHTAIAVSGRFPVMVLGCPSGIEVDVVHSAGMVTIRSEGGQVAAVSAAEWRDAVLGFVDEVQAFYDASPPRDPVDESTGHDDWPVFWQEWRDRRAAAQQEVG